MWTLPARDPLTKPRRWKTCATSSNASTGPATLSSFFPDVNLVCGVSEAISWFFCHEEMGIVLEHDCLPSPDFFRFCQEMLLAYRTDTRVFHVGGTAVPVSTRSGETASYSFIRIPLIWGWASWRRAWGKYSLEMAGFDEFVRCNSIRSCVTGLRSENNWLQYFHRSCQGAIDSWDYQWTFAMMKNHALAVIPHRNLVSNIGFGSRSTSQQEPTLLFGEFADREIGLAASKNQS